ncbi:MAG TPA: cysteine--tRNA ligase [Actinomycetota bacterium]|jgi:L-cysteine:1D-myo-inositol 2-amino-2-deoxy-alpha-D-glucopyranoside ligase
MRLFDRASGDLREVQLRPRMGMYVCGITPYDSAHLGHAFTYVHFDVLARYLRHLGSEVRHVQNVTDVDDDMLRVAKARGVDYRELAEREVASFEGTMQSIGVSPPTHSPRATEFVADMIEEVEALVPAGHGYQRNGTVYFRVASDPRYGRLSGLTREQMLPLAAERGGHPEDPRKDDPLDFVLWQRSAPGEPWWESPWGRGRPGWHIECSTMSRKLLGQPVDIHGGGSDLIYPHHESELAQAEGVPGGEPFVLHWVHTGAVHMAGDKMSKSLGNLAFVQDLLERHPPGALRSFLLRRHYRKDWHFREEDLELETRGAASLETGDGEASFDPAADRDAFFRALEEDLDTPEAMRILDRAASSSEPAAKELLEEGKEIMGLLDL